MKSMNAILTATLVGALTLTAHAQHSRRPRKPQYHDPVAAALESSDDLGRSIFEAFESYDADAMLERLQRVEARRGTPQALESDDYMLAVGYLDVLVVQRFFERHDEEHMPTVLRDADLDELAEGGLAAAERYAEAHPDHSDILRVRGELLSYQIRGMIKGMSKGPKARKSIERALEMDGKNGWALYAQARMHYHNPAFVGGDLDLALYEFRKVAESFDHFRVAMYLAAAYRKKEMLPQALFWSQKSLELAPQNPEAAWLVDAIRGDMKEVGQ